MIYHGADMWHGVTTRRFCSHRCLITAKLVSAEAGGHYVVFGGQDLPRIYDAAGPVDVDSVGDGKRYIAETFAEIADALGAPGWESPAKTKADEERDNSARRRQHVADMREALSQGDYDLAHCYQELIRDIDTRLKQAAKR